MKYFICFLTVLFFFGRLDAGLSKFVSDVENPNGQPFMMSLGIEKNVQSF